ncbi:MAG: phosphatidylserine/phosphatidylglycerophosphate/cardiolipin synthase family protein [Gemmatimonadetes bacterium]|nr:phosphatidylserine/phosphatidylglycerophosphate/cardiolipin synthase family protein [Gemmatimonadota bacterium]
MSGARPGDLAPGAPPILPPLQQSRTYARGLWRIAAADVSAGNAVTLLRNGPATFDAILARIEGAHESVDLEQYIFRPDEIGHRVRDALVAAAARGVRVRVLVDWVGRMGTPSGFWAPLRTVGASVRIFHPPGFRSWFGLLPRDHRKLLVVDNRVGITGGIGIGDQWKRGRLRQRSTPWRDTCVEIGGPAAVDMAESFDRMWERAGGRRRLKFREVRVPRATHLDPLRDPPALVGIVEGEPGRLRLSRALQMQALGAERTFWIASAYFAPSWSLAEALSGAARDGVDVRVLVPSRYDHPWLRTLLAPYVKRLIGSGVRLWEWRGEMMHAKTTVVDGRWVRIGSTDFNALGVAINYELDAFIEDATLGRASEDMFLEDLERSRELYIRHQHVVTGPTRTGPAALPGPVTPTALTPTAPHLRLPQDDDDHSFPPTAP